MMNLVKELCGLFHFTIVIFFASWPVSCDSYICMCVCACMLVNFICVLRLMRRIPTLCFIVRVKESCHALRHSCSSMNGISLPTCFQPRDKWIEGTWHRTAPGSAFPCSISQELSSLFVQAALRWSIANPAYFPWILALLNSLSAADLHSQASLWTFLAFTIASFCFLVVLVLQHFAVKGEVHSTLIFFATQSYLTWQHIGENNHGVTQNGCFIPALSGLLCFEIQKCINGLFLFYYLMVRCISRILQLMLLQTVSKLGFINGSHKLLAVVKLLWHQFLSSAWIHPTELFVHFPCFLCSWRRENIISIWFFTSLDFCLISAGSVMLQDDCIS